jgi:hypothetical protein|uniref:Uncharacterized protein n=1 Tax=Zea mays TaxID=4577 RepID=C4J0W0_MAIZE|nr:unknown [Zea mays]
MACYACLAPCTPPTASNHATGWLHVWHTGSQAHTTRADRSTKPASLILLSWRPTVDEDE